MDSRPRCAGEREAMIPHTRKDLGHVYRGRSPLHEPWCWKDTVAVSVWGAITILGAVAWMVMLMGW